MHECAEFLLGSGFCEGLLAFTHCNPPSVRKNLTLYDARRLWGFASFPLRLYPLINFFHFDWLRRVSLARNQRKHARGFCFCNGKEMVFAFANWFYRSLHRKNLIHMSLSFFRAVNDSFYFTTIIEPIVINFFSFCKIINPSIMILFY